MYIEENIPNKCSLEMNNIQELKFNNFQEYIAIIWETRSPVKRLGMSSMKNHIYSMGNPNPLFKTPL
jgi:hypothetical protein